MREVKMFGIARRFKPDAMAGTDIVIAHIGKLLNIPSVLMNEDDAKEVPLFAKYGLKYCSVGLAPTSCNNSPYENKVISYPGYQELAYLHPKYFTPDKSKVAELFKNRDAYFLIRFAKLTSHHDKGKTGITDEIARKLISILQPHGNIYITSERPLEKEFEPYRFHISPSDMHHALYFAQLYIGDSQTMAAEAAVLGTPSIRFNDFVGRLGYLEELEHKFQLTFGIKTDNPEKLIAKTKELIAIPGLKEEWQLKRKRMLNETIDVAAFLEWFFENYPSSASILKTNRNKIAEFFGRY
jgi:predicted glycosyltransferase